jgi:hypothetical protein
MADAALDIAILCLPLTTLISSLMSSEKLRVRRQHDDIFDGDDGARAAELRRSLRSDAGTNLESETSRP